MKNEPTIHQLEKLLKAFREQGGSNAEISALAQDIIRDFRPEKVRPTSEIFGSGQPATIRRITDFKRDPRNPIKEASHTAWSHWYVKYPMTFLGLFLVIFAITNLPMYIAKLKPTERVTKEIVSERVVVKSAAAKSAPLEPGEVVPSAPTIVIPKISVTAPIIFVETYDEATIQASLSNGVVHYYQTAAPGKVGNSFLTGHSSNYWWQKGNYNYIFANLDKLVVGDQAKIYYEGNKLLYQVTSIKTVEPTDMSVLGQTSKPTLTLMTCTPPGTNWKRLIVSFDQVAPVYKAPTLADKAKTAVVAPAVLPTSDSNIFFEWISKIFGI